MRKIFLLMLVFVMVFSMESCSAGEEISLEETVSNNVDDQIIEEYDTNMHFHSYDNDNAMQEFLNFVDHRGTTSSPSYLYDKYVWSDFKENSAFLNWLDGKEQIPIPIIPDEFYISSCFTEDNDYWFKIKWKDCDKHLESIDLMFCIIPSEMMNPSLEELCQFWMREIRYGEHFSFKAEGESITGNCRYGEYILFDRYKELLVTGYFSHFPHMFFRYDDYLVCVVDYRKNVEQWDISFLDWFEFEMYDVNQEGD